MLTWAAAHRHYRFAPCSDSAVAGRRVGADLGLLWWRLPTASGQEPPLPAYRIGLIERPLYFIHETFWRCSLNALNESFRRSCSRQIVTAVAEAPSRQR